MMTVSNFPIRMINSLKNRSTLISVLKTNEVQTRVKLPFNCQYVHPKRIKMSYCLAFPQLFLVHAWFSSKKQTNETQLSKEETLVIQADNLYAVGSFDCLYELLIVHKDSDDIEILWRLARTVFEKGKATANNADKLKFFEEGLFYVNKGLSRKEDYAVLHKWFAILNDYKSRCEGLKARIECALINKEHMKRSIELSSGDPTVYYMLGYWCFAFASLTWYERKIAAVIFAVPPKSTFEEALNYFEKAENMDPNFYSMNLLMLGKCHDKLGNKEQAIEFLHSAASYEGDTLDDKEAKLEAEALLKKLQR